MVVVVVVVVEVGMVDMGVAVDLDGVFAVFMMLILVGLVSSRGASCRMTRLRLDVRGAQSSSSSSSINSFLSCFDSSSLRRI